MAVKTRRVKRLRSRAKKKLFSFNLSNKVLLSIIALPAVAMASSGLYFAVQSPQVASLIQSTKEMVVAQVGSFFVPEKEYQLSKNSSGTTSSGVNQQATALVNFSASYIPGSSSSTPSTKEIPLVDKPTEEPLAKLDESLVPFSTDYPSYSQSTDLNPVEEKSSGQVSKRENSLDSSKSKDEPKAPGENIASGTDNTVDSASSTPNTATRETKDGSNSATASNIIAFQPTIPSSTGRLTSLPVDVPSVVDSGNTPSTPVDVPSVVDTGSSPSVPVDVPNVVDSGSTPSAPVDVPNVVDSGSTPSAPVDVPNVVDSGSTPSAPVDVPSVVDSGSTPIAPVDVPSVVDSGSTPSAPVDVPSVVDSGSTLSTNPEDSSPSFIDNIPKENLESLVNQGLLDIKEGDSFGDSGGDFVQDDGTVVVNGELVADTYIVDGGQLKGSGQIGADVIIGEDGTISPGNSPGTITIDGSFTANAGSVIELELEFIAGGSLEYDQIVAHSFDLNGFINFLLIDDVALNDLLNLSIFDFFIISNSATGSGEVLNDTTNPEGGTMLVQGDVFDLSAFSGAEFSVYHMTNYDSKQTLLAKLTLDAEGNFVKVPEPSSLAIILLGLLLLFWRRTNARALVNKAKYN